MMALVGNANFSLIEMETIWKVVEACITCMKRNLKTPISTPRETLYIETGLLDPESIIKKNRISMESRITMGDN